MCVRHRSTHTCDAERSVLNKKVKMMKDAEIRGILLQKYYEHRRERYISFSSEDFNGQISDKDIAYISDQLSEHGLIAWQPTQNRGELVGGFGHISAFGVDVIENEDIESPIKIVFDQRNISVTESTNVQIGNGNIQTETLTIGQIIEAIDKYADKESEKKEAKSRLKAFLEHPLVTSILNGLSGSIM